MSVSPAPALAGAGSTPDFPGPEHHRGRSDSTGPPASSSLSFWLAEPGSRPRHSTLPSPQTCTGLGNHLGSPLSSGEGGSEESPGSSCNPRAQRCPPPLGGGAAGTSSAASAVGVQLVGGPSRRRRRRVRTGAPLSRAPAAGFGPTDRGLRLAPPPRTRSSQAPSWSGRRGGNAKLRAARTCLTDRQTLGSGRVPARARARASRACRRPRGRDRTAASGRGARGARAPHPRAAERYFGWQEAPRHFRRAASRARGFTPAREASRQVGCGRAAAAAPSRSSATLSSAYLELKPRRDADPSGVAEQQQQQPPQRDQAESARSRDPSAFPTRLPLPPLLPAVC